MGRIRRHWKGFLAGAVVLVAVLAVGVPFAYIHLVEGDQPAPLSLDNVPASGAGSGRGSGSGSGAGSGSTANDTAAVSGTWRVSKGSQAGYRVDETLAGQSTTAVGRTSSVTGSLTVSGTAVSAGQFTVRVADITSDHSQRDAQFAGRIMQTAQYPTASFRLTRPIQLGSVPTTGTTVTERATGNLTLHGTTKQVTFPVSAKRTADGIAVSGDIDVAYGDYGIDNPSFGNFVSVGTRGTVEFLLVTTNSDAASR